MRCFKIITVSFLLLFSYSKLNAQGGVNVKEIEIDSLNSNYLNKKVKIIFNNKSSNGNYYWYRSSRGNVKLKGKEIELISNNGRGTDYWYFEKAYLESENYAKDFTIRIYECIIKEMSKDSITFQWKLQYYKETEITDSEKCRKKKNHVFKYGIEKSKCLAEDHSEITTVSMPRKLLDIF